MAFAECLVRQAHNLFFAADNCEGIAGSSVDNRELYRIGTYVDGCQLHLFLSPYVAKPIAIFDLKRVVPSAVPIIPLRVGYVGREV